MVYEAKCYSKAIAGEIKLNQTHTNSLTVTNLHVYFPGSYVYSLAKHNCHGFVYYAARISYLCFCYPMHVYAQNYDYVSSCTVSHIHTQTHVHTHTHPRTHAYTPYMAQCVEL